MSLPDTASACAVKLIPEPSALQLLPSHLGMKLAAIPPAVVNEPPAYRSLPDTASASVMPLIPNPSALQPLPFHLAIPLTLTATPSLLVALVNAPPAYNSLPETTNARTWLFIPEPSVLQALPFHLAM